MAKRSEDTYYNIFDDDDLNETSDEEEITIKGKKIKTDNKIVKIPKKKNLRD